jgi:hypothetical protein
MEQFPTSETNNRLISQEVSCNLRSSEVYYSDHESPQLYAAMSQMNPVPILLPISSRSFLVLFHLPIGFPNNFFLSGFMAKI